MIAGLFHKGSGLGNQLFRYVTARTVALDKGLDFAMAYPENFKGGGFMKLEMGLVPEREFRLFTEKKVVDELGVDIRGYDPEINFIQDNTIIDGEFQDERYWGHRLKEIDEWLRVDEIEIPDDVCVINFRGGEYSVYPDLYLTQEYWDEAIALMKEEYPEITFEVHTDDPQEARKFFPDFEIISDIGVNWCVIRHAKHLILSNSSFAILPALLSPAVDIIAPRYWARRNTKTWALPQNYYKRFLYI